MKVIMEIRKSFTGFLQELVKDNSTLTKEAAA
jgi:hypothetical protein